MQHLQRQQLSPWNLTLGFVWKIATLSFQMSSLSTYILATPPKLSFSWHCWGWAPVPLRWTSGHGIQLWTSQMCISLCKVFICGSAIDVVVLPGSHYGPSSWYHRLGCHPCCWGPLVFQRSSCSFLCQRGPGYWFHKTKLPQGLDNVISFLDSSSCANWWCPWFMPTC